MNVADRIERTVNPLPEHLALIACRRENVRLNRERLDYLERQTAGLVEVAAVLERLLVTVRSMMR